jgi:hypothetical protein
MSYFAQVKNGIVQDVIVADQTFINQFEDKADWIQTYHDANGQTDKGGNYAGIGYTYDATYKVFYGPSPFPSWTMNHSNWQWTAPVPMPAGDQMYAWDEATLSWKVVTMPVQS